MPKKQIFTIFPSDYSLPYSPVVKVGDHYHFSGIIPDVLDGKMADAESIEKQIGQVFNKIDLHLVACGLKRDDIYSATVMFSGSMDHFALFGRIYSEFFIGIAIKPRRKAFAVAALPFGAAIEIEIDAVKQE